MTDVPILSEPRIHWLAFQRQDTEHALMNAAQGFAPDEAFQRFDTQGELARRERSLGREPSRFEPIKVLRRSVFGPVDDPQVFAPAAFYRGLRQTAPALGDEVQRFYHHAFAAAGSQFPHHWTPPL